jgi:hypothetical protein
MIHVGYMPISGYLQNEHSQYLLGTMGKGDIFKMSIMTALHMFNLLKAHSLNKHYVDFVQRHAFCHIHYLT